MHYNNLLKKHQKQTVQKNINQLDTQNNQIRDSIIRPITIEKINNNDIDIRIKELTKSYPQDRLKFYENRTNIPYKGIIKNANYTNIKKEDDLIIHKISPQDKEGVDEEYKIYDKTIKDHNNELLIKFPKSKEAEYKTKFEYNRLYKTLIATESNNPDCKKDSIEFYKKEQEIMEKDKETKDQIIESLLFSGVLSEIETIPEEMKQQSKKGIRNITIIE